MNESLLEAGEELKRLEHTIYVTLKYTRTVDVIKSALERLISIFDFLIEALLNDARGKKLLADIPKSPSLKSSLVTKIHSADKALQKFITFYAFLRDILNTKQTKREEYRRYVTLITNFPNKTAEIDIDILGTYERVARQFYQYAWELIEGKVEEE